MLVLTGWSGAVLGEVAVAFDSLDAVLAPNEVALDLFEPRQWDAWGKLLLTWPFLLVLESGLVSCFLLPATGLLLYLAYYNFVQLEDTAVGWPITVLFASSLAPVMDDKEYWQTWVSLGFLWIGLGAFSWWLHRQWQSLRAQLAEADTDAEGIVPDVEENSGFDWRWRPRDDNSE